MSAGTLPLSLGCNVLIAALAAAQDPPPLRAHVEDPARSYDPSDPASIAAVRRTRGVWPVANGRVFAYVGLGDPANRLFMITGPHYQTEGNHDPLGAFGEQWIELREGEIVLRPARQAWRGVRLAAAAVTDEVFADGTVLTVRDLALAEAPTLLRRIELQQPDGAPGRTLVLRFSDFPHGSVRRDGRVLRKTYPRRERAYHLAVAAAGTVPADLGAEAGDQGFVVDVPVGSRALRVDLALVTARDPADADIRLGEVENRLAEIEDAALAAWRARLVETLSAEPDGPIAATMESVQVLTEAQRALPQGGVAPMVSFKGVWLRDSNGPLKTFLWSGRFEQARQLLTYYRAASALAGATHREFPLDLDVGDAPTFTAEQWAATGTDRCEVPSFVVLQHLWYYHATGDAELILEHYPYLRRNALHQELHATPDGPVQPFNGDETYLHGAFYSLFPQRDVWPNQFPSVQCWSLDSMLTYVACQRAMVELCAVAGHPEDAAAHRALGEAMADSIEQQFWLQDRGMYAPALSRLTRQPHDAPYAPINLAPLWLGTHAPDDPRALANLQAVIALLGREDGLCRMTPSVAYFIGSLPGYWLCNLAAVDHPLAWKVFRPVLASCSPSGEWVEVHAPDGLGHGYGDGTYANRLRPWESGLNFDAVLRFLTGATFRHGRELTLRPRLPDGLSLRRLGPLAVGRTRVELHYPEDPGQPVVVRHLRGPACVVNGGKLGAGASVGVELIRPADLRVPASRPWSAALRLPPGVERIVVRARIAESRPGDFLLDAGLPFSPEDLANLLFRDGKRSVKALVLDESALRADRLTMKPRRFWEHPVLSDALRRFEDAGGRIAR